MADTIKLYKREFVVYPYHSFMMYYTTKEAADAAYTLRDASRDIYVHDAGTTTIRYKEELPPLSLDKSPEWINANLL